MIEYKLSWDSPHRHYIDIEVRFPVLQELETVHLSRWRPGRYELGNFAKNIRDFKVFDENGNSLDYHKVNKDSWRVKNNQNKFLVVKYSYYANELNAGSTYLDDRLLYVNPVNCFAFTATTSDLACKVSWEKKEGWELAVGAKHEANSFEVANYDELADTPFLYSPDLNKITLIVQSKKFHICFNGITEIPEKVEEDFSKFIERQLLDFDTFPVDEFYFLIFALPETAYHGVEHTTSTVITLGPKTEIFESLYTELLGVSSHELYHVWNVKTIKPIDLTPIDYKSENYSRFGWIYEGITTYLGDWYLMTSGVFSLEEYLEELSKQFQRHLDNEGRFHYSVADSSFDTWLDGYVLGAPGRKVSIYVEGCLLAFYLDVMLRKSTKNEVSLIDFMRELHRLSLHNEIGYQLDDIQGILSFWLTNEQIENFIDYVHQPTDLLRILPESLAFLGLEMQFFTHDDMLQRLLGIKVLPKGKRWLITSVKSGSAADLAGIGEEDEIAVINGVEVGNFNPEDEPENFNIELYRKGRKMSFEVLSNYATGYHQIDIVPDESLDFEPETNRSAWMGRK